MNKSTFILLSGILIIVISIYYVKPTIDMIRHYFLENNVESYLNVNNIKHDMYGCDSNLSGNCFYLYDGKIENLTCKEDIIKEYAVCN